MELTVSDIAEDTRAYYSDDFGERVLEELFFNAYRTIKSVYLFKHFDQYVEQLKTHRNEDKKEEYWNAAYYEKLTDYIKISVAFENYNKATLIQKGYLVHKIQKSDKTKSLWKDQNNGNPIKVVDFKQKCTFIKTPPFKKYFLEGLQKGFPTISYSLTLIDRYQEIIGIDLELLYRLKKINENRNRLHFFTEFKGAFEVNSHINKWKYIKDTSLRLFEEKIESIRA